MRYVQVFFGLFEVLIGAALVILGAVWLIWVSPVVEPLSVIFGGVALIIAGGVTMAHWQHLAWQHERNANLLLVVATVAVIAFAPEFATIAWTIGSVTGISAVLLWVRYRRRSLT